MNNSETDQIDEISANDGSVGVYIHGNDSNIKSIQFWSEEETKYMMNLYEENIKKVGPSKRFRIKKMMWMYLATTMQEKFDRDFTAMQVENRFKNEQRKINNRLKNEKRKDRYINKNSPHRDSSYDNEFEQIMDMEDSLSPEVEIMSGTTSVRKKEQLSDEYYNTNQISSAPSPPFLFAETNENIIQKYMQQQQEIFKQKEEHKQRRHEEKLAVLKGISESLQRLLERKKKYTS